MRRYVYPARIARKAGTVLATFRDLPEAVTEGRTEGEAANEAYAVLEAALWFRLQNGEPIPEPTPAKRGEVLVPVDPATAAKLAFAAAFRDSELTRVQFAKMIKLDDKEIRRMLDPGHRTKIERLGEGMRALGRRLVVAEMQDETARL